LLRQFGESLAGRISFIEMTGFTVEEVAVDRRSQELLWLRGGFPDAFLADSDGVSLDLRKDFIRTYLERDLPMFGPRVPSVTMDRLWTMLAHLQGSILNASSIARALEVSTQSVTRYIDLLSDLLLVRRLPPFHANIGKRLEVYIRDSGIVHALLGLGDGIQLSGHPVVGASWEVFVPEAVLAVAPWPAKAYFYRTAAGAEIDLILEHPDGSVWAVEIKRGLSAKPSRGFYQAIEDLQPTRAFVVHAAEDRYPLTKSVEAFSLLHLIQELRSKL
jgi:predicted AAA+ superfamily ATPase